MFCKTINSEKNRLKRARWNIFYIHAEAILRTIIIILFIASFFPMFILCLNYPHLETDTNAVEDLKQISISLIESHTTGVVESIDIPGSNYSFTVNDTEIIGNKKGYLGSVIGNYNDEGKLEFECTITTDDNCKIIAAILALLLFSSLLSIILYFILREIVEKINEHM